MLIIYNLGGVHACMGLRVHYFKTTCNWPVYYLCDCVINESALSLVTDNVAGVIGVCGHAVICIYTCTMQPSVW